MKKMSISIQVLTLALVLLVTSYSQAQEKKERVSLPATVSGTVGGSNVTISYSQPSVKGRKVWGELVPYNKVWRTGANEATTLETTKNIYVEGVLLPAGKYALFTIPGEEDWTIIFNKVSTQWGAFKYEEKEDQLRVKVTAAKAPSFTEKLTFFIQENKILFRWENLEVGFKVTK